MNNPKDFSLKIETIVLDKNIGYMDAIVHYCEKNNMEVETAAKLINTKIKQCISVEASDLNLIKEKINKLPV